MEIIIVNGMVEIQEMAIILIISKFRVGKPLASPTPITDPTKVCVVEMGKPILEQIKTTVAAPNVAANPHNKSLNRTLNLPQ